MIVALMSPSSIVIVSSDSSVIIITSSGIISSSMYLCAVDRCLPNIFGEITLIHVNNHFDFNLGLDDDLLHGDKVIVHLVGVICINHKYMELVKILGSH